MDVSDSEDSDAEDECDDFNDEIDDEMEQYELRSESVMEIIQNGSIIALFSPSNALELFYLCKVVDFGRASEDMMDRNKHVVLTGQPYIKVQYCEQKSTKGGFIAYKVTSHRSLIYIKIKINVSFTFCIRGNVSRISLQDYVYTPKCSKIIIFTTSSTHLLGHHRMLSPV